MGDQRPPDLEGKVDFIWRQFVDVCDAPITVWVQAMRQPAINFLLAWFALDLKQIMIARYRPSSPWRVGRSWRHGGLGRKGKRGPIRDRLRKLFSWDPNEALGRMLDPDDALRGREVGRWGATLWLIEGQIERILFYWMVIELTTTFLYEWTSAVSQTIYCKNRDDAVLLCEVENYYLSGIVGWQAINWGEPRKRRNIVFYNGFGASQGVNVAAASFSISVTNIDPFTPTRVFTRLTIANGPRAGHYEESEAEVEVGESVDMKGTLQLGTGETFIPEVRVEGQGLITTGVFHLHANAYVRHF